MATYTYLAYDLLSQQLLAELPLTEVSFGRILNGAGEFSGTLKLSDPKVQKVNPVAATEPMRTSLYVDRDGVLIWGGIIWVRRYNPASQSLSITGNELWSYYRRRIITDAQTWTGRDQIGIAQDLVVWAQTKQNGDIGVNPLTFVGSTVPRDLTIFSYEQKPVGETVEDISQMEDGFDFSIDPVWVSGFPQLNMHFGFPYRGRSPQTTDLLFEFPGNALEPEWDEDGTESANQMFVSGDGDGGSALISTVVSTDMLDAGYPLLDGTMSSKDTTDQANLDARARAIATAKKAAITVPKLTVRADMQPTLGSYDTGDHAKISLLSTRFSTGLVATKRITAIDITPPAPGQAESVDLTLGDPAE